MKISLHTPETHEFSWHENLTAQLSPSSSVNPRDSLSCSPLNSEQRLWEKSLLTVPKEKKDKSSIPRTSFGDADSAARYHTRLRRSIFNYGIRHVVCCPHTFAPTYISLSSTGHCFLSPGCNLRPVLFLITRSSGRDWRTENAILLLLEEPFSEARRLLWLAAVKISRGKASPSRRAIYLTVSCRLGGKDRRISPRPVNIMAVFFIPHTSFI